MPDGPPGGAVLIARAMQDSAVWGMPEHYLKLWLYLLLNVRWDDKPHRLGPVTVRYGQVLKSYRVIAEECQHTHNRQVKRWSTSQVKRALEWLESEDMIKTLGTELGTLITVCNFKRYQAFSTYAAPNLEQDPEQPENNLEQPENNRKQEETRETNNNNWVGAVVDLWRGKAGEPNAGRVGRALKPIHDQYGTDTVLKVLEFYLDSEDPEYIKVERLAETFVKWGKKAKEARDGTGSNGKRGSSQPRAWDYENTTDSFEGFNEPDPGDTGEVPERDAA